MAQPRPFDFVSFEKTAPTEEPRRFSAGDLEAATLSEQPRDLGPLLIPGSVVALLLRDRLRPPRPRPQRTTQQGSPTQEKCEDQREGEGSCARCDQVAFSGQESVCEEHAVYEQPSNGEDKADNQEDPRLMSHRLDIANLGLSELHSPLRDALRDIIVLVARYGTVDILDRRLNALALTLSARVQDRLLCCGHVIEQVEESL